MKKSNPFLVNTYLQPSFICSRQSESDEVVDFISNGGNVQIVSRDGIGKSTLVKNILYLLKKDPNYISIYLNAYRIISFKQVIKLFIRIITNEFNSSKKKDRKKIQEFVNQFNNITSETELYALFEKIIHFLYGLEKKVVVALDHLTLLSLNMKQEFASHFLKIFSQPSNIRFIVASSEKLDFNFVETYQLNPIPTKNYKKFIYNMFNKDGKSISSKPIDLILSLSKEDPYTTQLICNRIWQFSKRNVKKDLIYNVYNNILKEYEPIFLNQRSLLTEIQWKLLIAIASNDENVQLTSSSFIEEYELNAPSSVNTAIKALLAKNLIYKNEKSYKISNVLMESLLSIKE